LVNFNLRSGLMGKFKYGMRERKELAQGKPVNYKITIS
jgi:hypothetical protein